MKPFAWVILGLSVFLLVGCGSDRKGNKIALIAELPNTSDYAIDGNFVDIGIVYNVVGYEGVNIYNYNKRWCLFNGNKYWVVDKTRLDEIAGRAGVTLPLNMNLSFWNEWGGRILIVIIILGFIIWGKIQPKLKTLKPFNANLNEHNAAKLIFDGHYKIKKFNGSNVNWSTTFAKAVSILLPPCECSLVFDYEESDGTTDNKASNHNTKNVIEAGKTYFLRSFLNDLNGNNILSTHIVEGKEDAMKDYRSVAIKASRQIKRVGVNITPDKAPQFINEFLQSIKNEGYNFVDEKCGNAAILFNEFINFPVSILDGEVYTYKSKEDMLLISRGELGIMLSFRKG